MPSVELSPLADKDVREIWRYTANTWSDRQANAYVDGLFDTMERLADDPARGRSADDIKEGLRRQRCVSHVIFYRQVASGVLIIRVLHASTDFAAHLADNDT